MHTAGSHVGADLVLLIPVVTEWLAYRCFQLHGYMDG